MRNTPHTLRAAMIALLVLLAGCGGDDPATEGPTTPRQAKAQAPGEVVVEPSELTITIGAEPTPALDLARDLLTADPPIAPAGYTLRIDETYDRPNRLRFVVEPADGQDDDATKQAAGAAYDALAAAFAKATEQAMRAELGSTEEAFDRTSAARQEAQDALRNYLALRSGLPDTNEVRLEKRRLNLKVEQLLEQQGDLKKQAESLERNLGRERWATLRRIR
ncbi:MAG: hypothetical protein ACE37H_06610 [Phycisphaeraceae bacterium]